MATSNETNTDSLDGKKATEASKDAKTRRTSSPRVETPLHDASFYRAPNEDDDGYDPYSDRPASREPLFERDPWS
ncbi:MAG: hypothetical protein IJ125_09705 [Atopobiaceae bacterium]|nr:hypothetical protein [Atopobiaceae bacterium]